MNDLVNAGFVEKLSNKCDFKKMLTSSWDWTNIQKCKSPSCNKGCFQKIESNHRTVNDFKDFNYHPNGMISRIFAKMWV